MPIASTAGATISADHARNSPRVFGSKRNPDSAGSCKRWSRKGRNHPKDTPSSLDACLPRNGRSILDQARLVRPTQLSTFRCAIAASKWGGECLRPACLRSSCYPLTQGGTHRKQGDHCASEQHACVTVFGEAEKVTHSFHCRNSLSHQGASHAPST